MMSENQDSRLGCRWTLEEDIEMCKLREKGYNFKEIGKILKEAKNHVQLVTAIGVTR